MDSGSSLRARISRRSVSVLAVVLIGILLLPSAAIAQYPPPTSRPPTTPPPTSPSPSPSPSPTPRCTDAQRAAFEQKQTAELNKFRKQRRKDRYAFKASGPHTEKEKRRFRRLQRKERRAFRRLQQAERIQFEADCAPARSAQTSASRPALTVGHLFLIGFAGLGVVLLLLRRRWASQVIRR